MIENRFKVLYDEIQKNQIENVQKVNSIRDQVRDYQIEIEKKFMEDNHMIQERATYQDLAHIREEMQVFATNMNLKELRRELKPEVA